MPKPKVYLETTVPSYLTAWPKRDPVIAGHQQTTRDWWQSAHERFDLFVSQFVLDEVASGDPVAARERLEALDGVPELDVTEDVENLAEALIAEGAIPEVAQTDALHIAVAAVHGIDFIVTWNFRHIANATMRPRIRQICERRGWRCPEICSPEELMAEGEI